MSVRSKTSGWIAIIAVVAALLVAAAVRFFGTDRTVDVADAEPEEFDTPYVIRSIPSKAKVYVNNQYMGLTPFPYDEFDPGILRIRLEHESLAPVETLLIVRESAPTPIFDPFVFSVPVELTSVPAGAHPVVNGRTLRPYEIASFTMRATDTARIAFSLPGEEPTSVMITPLSGLMEDADTLTWQWTPSAATEPARLTRVFAQELRITSEPPGAAVLLDNRGEPIGYTNGHVAIPYGDHTLTLRLPPFEDYVVPISAGRDRRAPIAAVLLKTVWLTAVDASNPYAEIKAKVEWIKQNGQYVVNPDDRLITPSRAALEGRPSEIKISCPGYVDTTVTLATLSNELHVGLRPLPKTRHAPDIDDDGLAWVRFVVRQGHKKGVAGAEVFGIDKDGRRTVRYGPTDEEGVLTTRVPVGDYDWWAAKEGFIAGRPNGERIKSGRKTKEITLKVKPM